MWEGQVCLSAWPTMPEVMSYFSWDLISHLSYVYPLSSLCTPLSPSEALIQSISPLSQHIFPAASVCSARK